MFALAMAKAGVDLRYDWINYPVEVNDSMTFFVDIAIPDLKLGIEIDGPSHKDREAEDEMRDEWLNMQGWIILHFSNDEVWSRARALADEVVEELNDRKSTAILTRAPGTLLKLV
jgi:hypothetical protein